MRLRRCGFLVLAVLLASWRHPANAAPSFDCAKAGTIVEKTICATPALAAQDSKLAAAYRSVLDKLSAQGRAALRESELQWLSAMHSVCTATVPRVACIADHYTERQRQLAQALSVHGGVRILRVDQIATIRDEPDWGNPASSGMQPANPGFVTSIGAYPQIDPALSASDRAWNRKMAATLGVQPFTAEDAKQDLVMEGEEDYKIVTLTPRLISVEITQSLNAPGALDVDLAKWMIHWLRREGRELAPDDLFRPGSGWRSFLTDACFRNLSDRPGYFQQSRKIIAASVGDTEHWAFQRAGLAIIFEQFEVGPMGVGTPEVVIPWDRLSGYLRPSLPFLPASAGPLR
jgi:uncharacterized protein